MKKKGVCLFFVLILLFIVLVVSQKSSTDMQIKILGCSIDGVYAQEGQCIPSSPYFCESHNVIKSGFVDPDACSRGATPPADLSSVPICCPSGYGCAVENRGGIDSYYCLAPTRDCSKYVIKGECLGGTGQNTDWALPGQCFWDVIKGECAPRVGSCYEYNDIIQCTLDPQNVSRGDPNCRYGETESGGIPYTISQESCECFWDPAGTTGKCGLRYNITSTYGDGTTYSLCQYVLNEGECLNGVIEYSYDASYDQNTLGASAPLRGDARCTTREGKRRCGEPVVKVPYFAFYNVIMVTMLLFMFYYSRTKFLLSKK